MPKPLFSHVMNLRAASIGTSGLADGSVSYAKLAPDAQLWRDTGTALTPGTSFTTRDLTANGNLTLPSATVTKLGLKLTFDSFSTLADLCSNDTTALNYEVGRPGWILRLDCGADLFQLYRHPASSTSYAELCRIDGNGNLTIAGPTATKAAPGTAWVNPSDPRLKRDVAPYRVGLAALQQLQPISFRYNGLGETCDDGTVCHGFDTGAVAPVMPECIRTLRRKLHPDDAEETDIAAMDVSDILLALVNAVKELATRVAVLEGKP